MDNNIPANYTPGNYVPTASDRLFAFDTRNSVNKMINEVNKLDLFQMNNGFKLITEDHKSMWEEGLRPIFKKYYFRNYSANTGRILKAIENEFEKRFFDLYDIHTTFQKPTELRANLCLKRKANDEVAKFWQEAAKCFFGLKEVHEYVISEVKKLLLNDYPIQNAVESFFKFVDTCGFYLNIATPVILCVSAGTVTAASISFAIVSLIKAAALSIFFDALFALWHGGPSAFQNYWQKSWKFVTGYWKQLFAFFTVPVGVLYGIYEGIPSWATGLNQANFLLQLSGFGKKFLPDPIQTERGRIFTQYWRDQRIIADAWRVTEATGEARGIDMGWLEAAWTGAYSQSTWANFDVATRLTHSEGLDAQLLTVDDILATDIPEPGVKKEDTLKTAYKASDCPPSLDSE